MLIIVVFVVTPSLGQSCCGRRKKTTKPLAKIGSKHFSLEMFVIVGGWRAKKSDWNVQVSQNTTKAGWTSWKKPLPMNSPCDPRWQKLECVCNWILHLGGQRLTVEITKGDGKLYDNEIFLALGLNRKKNQERTRAKIHILPLMIELWPLGWLFRISLVWLPTP